MSDKGFKNVFNEVTYSNKRKRPSSPKKKSSTSKHRNSNNLDIHTQHLQKCISLAIPNPVISAVANIAIELVKDRVSGKPKGNPAKRSTREKKQ